jgi:hypothetical protein
MGGTCFLGRIDRYEAHDATPWGLLWLTHRGDHLLDGHLHRRRAHRLWGLCAPHECGIGLEPPVSYPG